MLRREFFSLTAGAAIGPQVVRGERLDELICQIERLVKVELPDVKSLEITYDPDDPRIPLMIVALRV